jgi:hypothetical protein
VHGRRAVAELGRADRQLVPAVGEQPDPRLAPVPPWRDRVDHPERRALSDQPVLAGDGYPVAAAQRLVDEGEAPVQPVASDLDVVRAGTGAHHLVAGPDDVALPERDRVHVQRAGQPKPIRSSSRRSAGCGSENSHVPPPSHASPGCHVA